MKNASFQVWNAALFAGLALVLILGAGAAMWFGGSQDSVAVLDAVDSASTPATEQKLGDGTESGSDAESDSGTDSYTHAGVEHARVSLNAPGDLTVEYSADARNAKVQVHRFSDQVSVDVSANDDTLTVASKCLSQRDQDCRADVVLVVAPSSTLDAYTAVGNIAVGEPNGPVRARADVGTISLSRPDAPVDAETGVGDITIRDAGSGDYSIAAGVGEVYVSMETAVGSIDASVGTGDVEIVVPKSGTKFEIRATTGLGETRLNVPSDDDGTPITAEVGVGDIEVRFP